MIKNLFKPNQRYLIYAILCFIIGFISIGDVFNITQAITAETIRLVYIMIKLVITGILFILAAINLCRFIGIIE